jgi:sulfur carrier protein
MTTAHHDAAGGPAGCQLTINGEARQFATGTTALAVVQALGLEGRPVAVEVNERVVPRAELDRCMLSSGDRLEVVTLVGGG